MKKITLTKHRLALVDDEDYKFLMQYKWCVNYVANKIYAINSIWINGKIKHFKMHRIILGLTDSKIFTDHINGNGLDNRKLNLRICTLSQNACNQIKRKGTSSIYKGVCWKKSHKKWFSQIGLKGKRFHLGYFDSEIKAAKIYNAKAKELHGEFARLNIIDAK